MANPLLSVLRKPLGLSVLMRMKKNIGLASIYYVQDVRHLYSRETLGLDGFEQQIEKTRAQMANIAEKFKEKMSEYAVADAQNMIFTEDLKNMIYIAENDGDIQLAIEMLKKYNKQNKSLRFGNFIFGPIVMRMLYLHNKPDLAIECFKSEELVGIFDQYISFQLLLDLLYENKKYKDILDMFDIIQEKQLDGQKYPKNVVVLVLAACYKMNNQQALDYALNLWCELTETGHQFIRRATTFCAGLALNQGKPDVSLEILSSAKNQNYNTVRNLKVAALAELGRIDSIIPILKSIFSADAPQDQYQHHTFNKDVLEKVKKAVAQAENPEFSLEYNRIEQIFQKQGHIADKTLDEQLCSEIQKPPLMNNRNFRQNRFDFQQQRQPQQNYNRRFQQRQRPNNWSQQRPGLSDLV